MYVQVVNFELQGVSHSDYEASCEALAPAFAEIPGLLSNVWMVEPGVQPRRGRLGCDHFSPNVRAPSQRRCDRQGRQTGRFVKERACLGNAKEKAGERCVQRWMR